MDKKILLAFAASTLMLAACGDDVTEIDEFHKDGIAVLEKGETLSEQVCDTTNVGEMLFVKDFSETFVCDGESWQTLKGSDGTNGKDGANGKDGKDGEKGADGADGKNGDDGKNGSSCTAKSVKKDGLEGAEISCGGTVVDTIWNGKDGLDGAVNDGVGCGYRDDGEGSVTVTCGEGDEASSATLYKALCGIKPYDPAKSFCLDDELYSCKGKPYDPMKSFCLEGELYSCNDEPYDPKKLYCLEVTRDGSKTYSIQALLTDSRDEQHKQVYKTVKIGDQVWMAENLNYSVNPDEQSWCGGGSGETEGDCSVYGRLYTWAAAVGKSEDKCGYEKTCNLSSGKIRGVCPDGWHLPSNDEWSVLIYAVSNTTSAGRKLKANSDLWESEDGISNEDSFGFSVLPAGIRDISGVFTDVGNIASFWSSSEANSLFATKRVFYYNEDHVPSGDVQKNLGFSVRCLKD